jgi:hypothetical protein
MFFWFFIPYIVLDYLCFEETMRGYGRVYLNEQLCMSRFPIYILSTFALFSNYARWQVSSKKIIGDLQVYLLSPQIAILLLNVVAIGFGITTIVADEHPAVPTWITAFVCVFAAIYALLAILVIKEAAKRAKYKRSDFRFDIPLPVKIESELGVSHLPKHFGLDSSATIKGSIYLPNGPVAFTAAIEPAEDAMRARGTRLHPDEKAMFFHWENQGDKDRLDLVLHACSWHRRFVYPAGFLTTPLEWIQQKLLRQSLPVPREKWKYVLYCYAHDPDKRFRLGALLVARGGEQSTRLVAFDVLPVGSRLLVIDPGVAASGERKILVVARGSLRDPSEADVDGATMINYDFVPDRDLDTSDVAAFADAKLFA